MNSFHNPYVPTSPGAIAGFGFGSAVPTGTVNPYASVPAPTAPMSFGSTLPAVPTPVVAPYSMGAGGPNVAVPKVNTSVAPAGIISDTTGQGTKPGDTLEQVGLFGNLTNKDGSLNWGSLGNIANIVGSFGGLWNAFQSQKLARETFNFEKQAYNTNLNNTLKSYNTALEDRAYSRATQNNADRSTAQQYVDQNRMTR